jgi:hypothetical protein
MSFSGPRKQEVLDAVNAGVEALEGVPDDASAKLAACKVIAAFARSMHESGCDRYGEAAYDVLASDIEGLA